MSVPASRGRRLRELGLRIGAFESGERHAITDVGGVRVGHVTVWSDEPGGRGIARTGVTAIVPGEGCSPRRRRPAPRSSTARGR